MKWFEFVFSNQFRLRYRRHTIFWLAWWIYFAGSYFFTQQDIEQAGSAKWLFIILLKSLLLVFCHQFLVYISIYLLLPRFIKKDKWISFSGILLIAIAITIAWGYFCYAVLFPTLDSLFHLINTITKSNLLWYSISAGFISALKVVIAAMTIKLVKYWWWKQKETERLEKEKIQVELKLLKAQIHPDMLFRSLDSIYKFAQNNPPRASELLLKLSDLLSYVLYESEHSQVPLEKELMMIKDYVALQKIQMIDQLEVSMAVKGDISDKMIAPLLLLPFLENSLSYCNHLEQEKIWVSIDIKIDADALIMKLVNGKSADQTTALSPYESGLSNVYKRLQALYPEKNELRIHAEPEVMVTYLKINLSPKYPQEEIRLSYTFLIA